MKAINITRWLISSLVVLLVFTGVITVGLNTNRNELSALVEEQQAIIKQKNLLLEKQIIITDELSALVEEQQGIIKEQEEDIELLESLLEQKITIEIKPIIEAGRNQ